MKQKYISVIVENTTNRYRNADVFNAIKTAMKHDFDDNGSYLKDGIKISSATEDVNYRDILLNSMKHPFKVDYTSVLLSKNGKYKDRKYKKCFQVNVLNINAEGEPTICPIIIMSNPFADGIGGINNARYAVDGQTKLSIQNIPRKTYFTLHMALENQLK